MKLQNNHILVKGEDPEVKYKRQFHEIFRFLYNYFNKQEPGRNDRLLGYEVTEFNSGEDEYGFRFYEIVIDDVRLDDRIHHRVKKLHMQIIDLLHSNLPEEIKNNA